MITSESDKLLLQHLKSLPTELQHQILSYVTPLDNYQFHKRTGTYVLDEERMRREVIKNKVPEQLNAETWAKTFDAFVEKIKKRRVYSNAENSFSAFFENADDSEYFLRDNYRITVESQHYEDKDGHIQLIGRDLLDIDDHEEGMNLKVGSENLKALNEACTLSRTYSLPFRCIYAFIDAKLGLLYSLSNAEDHVTLYVKNINTDEPATTHLISENVRDRLNVASLAAAGDHVYVFTSSLGKLNYVNLRSNVYCEARFEDMRESAVNYLFVMGNHIVIYDGFRTKMCSVVCSGTDYSIESKTIDLEEKMQGFYREYNDCVLYLDEDGDVRLIYVDDDKIVDKKILRYKSRIYGVHVVTPHIFRVDAGDICDFYYLDHPKDTPKLGFRTNSVTHYGI
ncbi:unnamed protein product [Bursaphelenchus okinawaensis]|uniref:F-box domain-containing protein n=1 Tax=Bursaphelenchus okinawaensis TaxID=465554 RepID=A0A811K8Q5_9BILA|nr:unnamed protein product [Bursaphelenchus okinawaensis]CAG9095983.1 unnamed protein product [Bursaphelenchus okinawaensis]